MKFPALPQKGKPVEDTVRDLINYVRASRIINVSGGKIKTSPNGTTIEVEPNGPTINGTVSDSICQFGTITESGEDTVILGGLMICGDQNFNVADKVLALGTDGAWLVEISLASIEPAVDDDEEIFLPGVITSTGTPAWALNAFTGTEDYTSNTDPADATSTGTIIIPIGILRIVSGVATLAPTGCGTIRVTQCAGILDHTRG